MELLRLMKYNIIKKIVNFIFFIAILVAMPFNLFPFFIY